jgi:hypothetical protein
LKEIKSLIVDRGNIEQIKYHRPIEKGVQIRGVKSRFSRE